MTITDFLLARIAEDEAAARAATFGLWEWVGDPRKDEAFLLARDGDAVVSAYGMHTEGYIECSDADRAHITRNQPARVLAECAAKRAILGSLTSTAAAHAKETHLGQKLVLAGMDTGLRLALQYLTLPYSEHPDYDPEWARG